MSWFTWAIVRLFSRIMKRSSQRMAWSDGEEDIMVYVCPCGYEYDEEIGDPDSGIAPGTKWEDIPEDWVCPVCGLGKEMFEEA